MTGMAKHGRNGRNGKNRRNGSNVRICRNGNRSTLCLSVCVSQTIEQNHPKITKI